MTRDTRIALFLMGELVSAVRANDSDGFRDLLSEEIEELGFAGGVVAALGMFREDHKQETAK